MAAYAALVSLLNNVNQIMNRPHLSTYLDNKHIQTLLEKTGFLLDFIEGYNYGGGSKEASDMERQIASAAHAAEDLIESHILDQLRAETLESINRPYLLTFVLKCVGFCVSDGSEKSLDLQQTNEAMDAIVKEASEFKERHIRLVEEQQPTHLARTLMEGGESAIVGLDAELNKLLDELTGYQSSRRIISIVGMGGMGKTTLAKKVHENLLIKELFHFRAWSTISQENNAQEILSKLLSGLGELCDGTIDDLGLKLHKTLLGRRYLIVLDDIWSVTAWDEVKRFFPDNRNGSRILLTTRLSNVAKDCGSSLFMINLLDEENSWKLFQEKAFQNDVCPPKLRKVGEEIVRLCKGLALSIVVIGGLLLKSPRTIGYWKKVAEDLKSIPNSKEKQESLDVLSFSYNHLPPHLKPCFLYMGVFKEDSEIRVSRIIRLWVAEGFIKPIGTRVLEEIAEGYINDLIDRNLISLGRRRKNGKSGYCGIHDLLRDLCIKLGEEQDFCQVSKSAYKLLRVVDETSLNEAKSYDENLNLRYLAFKRTYGFGGHHLPYTLYLMWNLQSLNIGLPYGDSIVDVPADFWKMRQLRHMECHRIYVPAPLPSNVEDGLLMLENLQTLKTVVNLRLCEEVCKIIPNVKNLHLDYYSDYKGYDVDSLLMCMCNLDRLPLASLNLRIRSRIWPAPDIELNKNLLVSFPRSLIKLSLKECQLHWDDLVMIGSLPQLEVLKLEVLSVRDGEVWSPVEGQFCRLKFLEIRNCRLVSWDVDSSHFPVLEKLILFLLLELEEIPLDIGDIPTLQLIRADRCSESAAISAVKIKEDQLENDDLHVQVVLRERSAASFNRMLESEELTTDNIQFNVYRV